MKAYEISAFGVDNLKIVERPSPTPGPGQLLLRMKAWSLNYRDLLVVKGQYNPKLKLPFTPFSDGAGEVIATGDGVSAFRKGDRVMPIFMQGWLTGPYVDAYGRTALGGAIPGVLAEEIVVDTAGVVAIPEELSDIEAATLPCAAVTAWDALFSQGNCRDNHTILVLGSGGVSLFALQFAKLAGARVIATTGTASKEPRLRDLGADDVINYRETPDWEKKVRELTGGAGVDHVVEVGGAGTLQKSLLAAKGGGRVSIIGNLSGLTTEVNVAFILHKFLTVQGIFVGSREMFEAMNRAIGESHLKPVVDRVFGFEEVPQALAHMESGAHFGKIAVSAP
jgi:NADPH:quinone reductase-like Zn-dependent oxidoreductase